MIDVFDLSTGETTPVEAPNEIEALLAHFKANHPGEEPPFLPSPHGLGVSGERVGCSGVCDIERIRMGQSRLLIIAFHIS